MLLPIKKYILTFYIATGCVCFYAHPAMGQDTLLVPLNNPVQTKILDITLTDAAGIIVQPFGNFRRTEIDISTENGSFRQVQKEEKNLYLQFKTQGIREFKKWTLFGRFAYTRSFLKGLAWDLSSNRKEGDPYYFASAKPGNWDKENYKIKGAGIYRGIKNLDIGFSVDYNTENAARTNDPRPSLSSHQMHFEPFVRYSFKRLGIALGGIYGYGSESTNVMYTNEQENDRPSAMEYITYEILGYGNLINSVKYYRTLENKNNTRGGYVQLNMKQNKYDVWARLSYRQFNDTTLRNINNYEKYNNLIGRYKLEKKYLMFGINSHCSNNFVLNTLMKIENQSGRDAMYITLAGLNNYLYERNETALTANLTQYHSALSTSSYALSAGYISEEKKDGASQHYFNRHSIYTKLFYGKTLPAHNKSRWIMQVEPGIEFNNASLSVPETQENIFTQAVAIPNEKYYSTNCFSLQARGGYGFLISPRQQVSILLCYTGRKAINNTNLYSMRNHFAINLNFNF